MKSLQDSGQGNSNRKRGAAGDWLVLVAEEGTAVPQCNGHLRSHTKSPEVPALDPIHSRVWREGDLWEKWGAGGTLGAPNLLNEQQAE